VGSDQGRVERNEGAKTDITSPGSHEWRLISADDAETDIASRITRHAAAGKNFYVRNCRIF